ncbi:hypothetical protein CEXT_565531 [Caerostris extrusa]|uniref:LAGLIDADG homing endonuclease n=1 Tax=Caerostris extrusa TaxID=172846 RepID=A0AAV4WGT3_CAEEX|nr:hypothetical protein CEXT_565531 [Caerostris extrusa]
MIGINSFASLIKRADSTKLEMIDRKYRREFFKHVDFQTIYYQQITCTKQGNLSGGKVRTFGISKEESKRSSLVQKILEQLHLKLSLE